MSLLTPDEVHELAKGIADQLAPGILIRTASAHLEAGLPVGGEMSLSAGIELRVARPSSLVGLPDKSLLVRARYAIEATPQNEDVPPLPRAGWKCEVELHGLWKLEDEGDLADDQLRAFAARVGLMALHPYARSHVQNAVTEAGWPAFTLDVMTPSGALFESPESPGMCDLDGIEVT